MATIEVTAAGAQERQIPPERWVRQVCSSWSKYADADIDAFISLTDVLGRVKAGELDATKARDRLVRMQQDRVKAIEQVVGTVRRSGAPTLDGGDAIRRSYLNTVNEYRAVETRQLAEYRQFALLATDQFHAAVHDAEGRRVDNIDAVGYDPLEELKASPALAPAIDGAAACNDVAEWLDRSALSPYAVGQCLTLTANRTLSSIQLRDTEQVDCATPHTLEVFVQTKHPAPLDEPYPGDEPIRAFADQQCTDAFAGYVGQDFDSSSLDIYWFYPDSQSWKANDREILCLLAPGDEVPRTGSAQGSGL
jgi:hypothetical protein